MPGRASELKRARIDIPVGVVSAIVEEGVCVRVLSLQLNFLGLGGTFAESFVLRLFGDSGECVM